MIELDFKKAGGMVTAIAQDWKTKEVLMQAFMNEEAWKQTLATGYAVYFSRSRNKLWKKGESSGNLQVVKEVRVDCDMDSVLLLVEQIGGAACHEGFPGCYFRKVENNSLTTITDRVFNPEEKYGK